MMMYLCINMILKGGWGGVVISLIFPKVPQSFLGILKVPQEYPLPLDTPGPLRTL